MNCTNHAEAIEGIRHCSRCGQPFCTDCLIELRGLTLCASCKNEQLLDLRSGAVTAGSVDYASIGRRWAALIVDRLLLVLLIVAAVVVVSLFTPTNAKEPQIWAMFLAVAVPYAAYVAYDAMMVRGSGQTIGKRLLKIRVVRADGERVSLGRAWGRALTRGVMVHVLGLVNYGPSLFTKEKTCVHDLLAGTRVVNAE